MEDGGGFIEAPPSDFFLYYRALGAKNGALPNYTVGWATVFIILVYRFCRADHYFWRHENTQRGAW